MKVLLVVDIDENHLLLESNDLYDRMKGRKCILVPMPEKIDIFEQNDKDSDSYPDGEYLADKLVESQGYTRHGCCTDVYCGWNACVDAITGETEWQKV